MMLCSLFVTLFGIASLERALDSYAMDEGIPPIWMTKAKQKLAEVERWYVDQATAECKKFTYKGSLGNFNNFVSKSVCQNHLVFTPEEKVNACAQPKSTGSCTVPEMKQQERWYYSKDAAGDANEKNSCHMFKYSGCGGNANNFETKEECLNACHNTVNSAVADNPDAATLTKVPNKFDCQFWAEVDSATPKMGVVPHKDQNRCVYAAVGGEAKRGFFQDLPHCVETCITNLVAACKADGPYQAESANLVTQENEVQPYFYFDKQRKACYPFLSRIPTSPIRVDDGANNIFSSVEMCASFCPATAHVGELKAVEACKQEKVGEATATDKYQLDRYYYTTATGANQNTCQSFKFNGKKMNMNNFKTQAACEAICKNPLTAGSN